MSGFSRFAFTTRLTTAAHTLELERARVILLLTAGKGMGAAATEEVTHRTTIGMTELDALQSVTEDIVSGRWWR